MRSRLPMHYVVVWGAFTLGIVAVFCSGGGDDPSRISLTGKVTLDGRPLKSGTIRFFMTDYSEQVHVDVSVLENGNYAITNSDRLVPGAYEVQVLSDFQVRPPWVMKSVSEFPPDERVRVASRYNENSVLKVKIERGGLNKFDFDLKN
jgi:hypothetical protein